MATIYPLDTPSFISSFTFKIFFARRERERSADEYVFCRNFAHKTVYLIRVFMGTLVDSRFSSGEGLAVCRRCTSKQASSRRLTRMIYDRSYPKSGYWNFNIRYNRPILPSSNHRRCCRHPCRCPSSPSDVSLRSSTLSRSSSCARPLSASKVERH